MNFGVKRDYQPGDVLVWRGENPIIGKVVGKCSVFPDCFYISRGYSSLHYKLCRPATPDEIKRLGDVHAISITLKEALENTPGTWKQLELNFNGTSIYYL